MALDLALPPFTNLSLVGTRLQGPVDLTDGDEILVGSELVVFPGPRWRRLHQDRSWIDAKTDGDPRPA